MHDAESRTNWEIRPTPYCTCRYAPCTYIVCIRTAYCTYGQLAVVGLEAPLHHKAIANVPRFSSYCNGPTLYSGTHNHAGIPVCPTPVNASRYLSPNVMQGRAGRAAGRYPSSPSQRCVYLGYQVVTRKYEGESEGFPTFGFTSITNPSPHAGWSSEDPVSVCR